MTAEIIFQAARQGDEIAGDLIRQEVEYLAVGLTNLVHLLNPQVIALGGGVAVGGSSAQADSPSTATASFGRRGLSTLSRMYVDRICLSFHSGCTRRASAGRISTRRPTWSRTHALG